MYKKKYFDLNEKEELTKSLEKNENNFNNSQTFLSHFEKKELYSKKRLEPINLRTKHASVIF